MKKCSCVIDTGKEKVLRSCQAQPEVVIPQGVTAVVDSQSGVHFGVFEQEGECIRSIEFPASVTTIGWDIFVHCRNLESIRVSEENPLYSSVDGVLYRDGGAVLLRVPPGKSGRLVVPEGVRVLESDCFSRCGKLTEIVLPDGLETVGFLAFSQCNPDTRILYRGEVYTCEWESIDALCRAVMGHGQFSDEEEEYEEDEDEGNDFCELYRLDEASGELVIRDGVFSLQQPVFDPDDFDYDESDYPRRVFQSKAGRACTGITLPKSLVLIGDNLFDDCEGLVRILVAEGNPSFRSVDGVLYDRDMTMLIAYPQNRPGEYVIPESVTDICRHAFDGCEGRVRVVFRDRSYGKDSPRRLRELVEGK